jgi:hypothetical protein
MCYAAGINLLYFHDYSFLIGATKVNVLFFDDGYFSYKSQLIYAQKL